MDRGYRLFALMAVTFLAISCGSARRVQVIQRDSTIFHIVDSVILRDSVVYVEVPKEQDKAVVPEDDSSHLETSVAESDAWVNAGQLHHILRNKPVQIPAPVVIKEKLRTESKDHLRVEWRDRLVERKFTKWESFQIILGRIALVMIALWILWVLYKHIK